MRRPLTVALALLLAVLLGGLGLLGYRLVAGGPEGGPSVGGPFTLVDGDGRTVTDQSFRGKWLLIYFGYTHCPDACPTALNDMATALAQLGPKASAVQPIFITVDPERDTPAVVKDYVAAFGAGIVGLTGSPDQLAAVEREYRVYAAKRLNKDGSYDMDHSSIIYLMDPEGHPTSYFSHETKVDELAEALRKAVG